jgi:hypothetical protein
MSEVSRNRPTHCGASAGATPEYTAHCQSSEGPEITGGPEYGSARGYDLCAVIWRSDRSGAPEFHGTVVTDTGVVMEFRSLARTKVRSSRFPRHNRDSSIKHRSSDSDTLYHASPRVRVLFLGLSNCSPLPGNFSS